MASVNKVILIGNLGADPEVRYTQSGQAVANLRIATSEQWTDKEGQRQERTEWHQISVWGKTAELCGQYLAKGRSVYVEGALRSREYTDKEGVNRKVWEVQADKVTFLGSGGERGGGGGGEGGWSGGGGGERGGGGGGGERGGGGWSGGGGGSSGGGGGGGNWRGGGGGGGNRGGGGGGGGGNRGGGGGGDAGPGFDDDPIPF